MHGRFFDRLMGQKIDYPTEPARPLPQFVQDALELRKTPIIAFRITSGVCGPAKRPLRLFPRSEPPRPPNAIREPGNPKAPSRLSRLFFISAWSLFTSKRPPPYKRPAAIADEASTAPGASSRCSVHSHHSISI